MKRPGLHAVLVLFVLSLVACGGEEMPHSNSLLASASALSARSPRPIPGWYMEGKLTSTWPGTAPELMFADAWGSCVYPEFAMAPLDRYLQYIRAQMNNTGDCPGDSTVGTSSDTPMELYWLGLRTAPACNYDPATKESKSANLKVKTPALDEFVLPEVPSPRAGTVARAALRAPVVNLCIAEHLRASAPGASVGEALSLSAADQRQLLALVNTTAGGRSRGRGVSVSG